MTINLEIILTTISAISSLLTVIIAYSALHIWRKAKKADLAEEIIVISNTIKDIIGWARCPGAYQGERKSRKEDIEKKHTGERNSTKDCYYVCVERIHQENDIISKVSTLSLKSSLHFKSLGIDKHFSLLLEIIKEIKLSSHSLIRGDSKNREKYELVI